MIYLGSDHGGFDLKEKIKKWLTQWGYQWEDTGNTIYEGDDDYPDFALEVAKKVAQEAQNGRVYPYPWRNRPKGILICRSAAGMVIAANKVAGVHAAAAVNEKLAKLIRTHNDANVLALSGDWLEPVEVKKIVKTWLTTEFSGEPRHLRRLKKIEEFEKASSSER